MTLVTRFFTWYARRSYTTAEAWRAVSQVEAIRPVTMKTQARPKITSITEWLAYQDKQHKVA